MDWKPPGGSVTALPIVETQAGDISAYTTNVIYNIVYYFFSVVSCDLPFYFFKVNTI